MLKIVFLLKKKKTEKTLKYWKNILKRILKISLNQFQIGQILCLKKVTSLRLRKMKEADLKEDAVQLIYSPPFNAAKDTADLPFSNTSWYCK